MTMGAKAREAIDLLVDGAFHTADCPQTTAAARGERADTCVCGVGDAARTLADLVSRATTATKRAEEAEAAVQREREACADEVASYRREAARLRTVVDAVRAIEPVLHAVIEEASGMRPDRATGATADEARAILAALDATSTKEER